MYAEQQEIDNHKNSLMEALILGYPDSAKIHILNTNATDHNVGVVLYQLQDDCKVVVPYYSKAMSDPEKNYCLTSNDFLPAAKAVKHFRPYFYGQMFRLQTNRMSLIWLRYHEC